MLPIVKIENDRGEVLDFSKSPRYVAMLTGTGPPSATINRATVSVADGTRYNSARVNERELLLTIHIVRDVARARLNLYRFIATKSHVKLYYQADGLDVYIEGYVETAEVNPWEQNQYVQVSIICPMPFWQDIKSSYADASQVTRLFEFPFSIEEEGVELSTKDTGVATLIENGGTVETGVTFVITATVTSTNPRIHNLSTGEFIGVHGTLEPGDQLEICTVTGSKRITHIRGGVRTNYINALMLGSSWLQMVIGANEYSYTVDAGECELGVYHTNMYTGV